MRTWDLLFSLLFTSPNKDSKGLTAPGLTLKSNFLPSKQQLFGTTLLETNLNSSIPFYNQTLNQLKNQDKKPSGMSQRSKSKQLFIQETLHDPSDAHKYDINNINYLLNRYGLLQTLQSNHNHQQLVSQWKRDPALSANLPLDNDMQIYSPDFLFKAIEQGSLSKVKEYFKGFNQETELYNSDGFSPLHYSVLCRSHEIFDYLRTKNASLITEQKRNTILHTCIKQGDGLFFNKIYSQASIQDKKWLVFKPDQSGLSPLRLAAKLGYRPMVVVLLGHYNVSDNELDMATQDAEETILTKKSNQISFFALDITIAGVDERFDEQGNDVYGSHLRSNPYDVIESIQIYKDSAKNKTQKNILNKGHGRSYGYGHS